MLILAHLALILVLAPAGNSNDAMVQLEIDNLRSSGGMLQLCVTANAEAFPDCSRDANAIKRSVPATSSRVDIPGIAPGRYAITLFHDRNANGRLDTTLGIPREGFGFSRNPVVRFGAPKFSQVVIDLPAGVHRHRIRVQYVL